MKLVLRMGKRGFEAGLLVVVILALVIAIVTIGAAGKIIGAFLLLLYPL